jgi:hypothetical protein
LTPRQFGVVDPYAAQGTTVSLKKELQSLPAVECAEKACQRSCEKVLSCYVRHAIPHLTEAAIERASPRLQVFGENCERGVR